MNNKLKLAAYKVLDMLTLGKGMNRTFQGNTVRMPTRYYKYFEADYEKDNIRIINDRVKSGMVIMDIGAHIGLMTAILGKKVGPTGKVFSFEPTPSTFKILQKTVAINNLSHATVNPFAVSDKKGTLSFYVSEHDADNSNSLSNSKRTDRTEGTVDVQVVSVDDYIKEHNSGKVDFIKIDVEGAELKLLKGAVQTIRNNYPDMILALHPASIRNFGDSLEEIWDLTVELGYIPRFEGRTMTRQEFIGKDILFDVFLTRK